MQVDQHTREGRPLAILARETRGGESGADADRRLPRYGGGDCNRALQLLTGRSELLHQSQTICLLATELVAGEQDAHGIAPAQLLHQAYRRTADRIDAALDLDLREPGAICRDSDVSCKQQLQPDG